VLERRNRVVTISRQIKNAVKDAIRNKYAWPGGYPIFIVLHDGESLCVDCAREEFKQIVWDWIAKVDTGWFADGADINYEDDDLSCCHCYGPIESAHGKETEDVDN
jgi:hypothetical protein